MKQPGILLENRAYQFFPPHWTYFARLLPIAAGLTAQIATGKDRAREVKQRIKTQLPRNRR